MCPVTSCCLPYWPPSGSGMARLSRSAINTALCLPLPFFSRLPILKTCFISSLDFLFFCSEDFTDSVSVIRMSGRNSQSIIQTSKIPNRALLLQNCCSKPGTPHGCYLAEGFPSGLISAPRSTTIFHPTSVPSSIFSSTTLIMVRYSAYLNNNVPQSVLCI